MFDFFAILCYRYEISLPLNRRKKSIIEPQTTCFDDDWFILPIFLMN
jgi:hypothetical protein